MELFWVRFHFAAQAQSTPYSMLLSVYLFKNFTHVMAVRVLTDIIIYRSCAIPAYLYVARPNVESLEKVLTSCFVSSSPFHGSYSNNPRSVNWVWGDRLNTWDFFGSERVVVWYLSLPIRRHGRTIHLSPCSTSRMVVCYAGSPRVVLFDNPPPISLTTAGVLGVTWNI